MYDLGIIINVCLEGHWLPRIYNFRKYGLLNIGKSKIKVFLLVGKHPIPQDLREGWPCEIEFVTSNLYWHGPKTFEFVLNLKTEEIQKYRWWFKIDEDSINDISHQIKRTDEEFDWEKPEYVFGHYDPLVGQIFIDAVKKTKHRERFLPTGKTSFYFHHEYESSLMSSSCLQKIIEDDECRFFLKLLTSPDNDSPVCHHDQGLAIAARFIKIHGTTSMFMSKDPIFDDFSLFGGTLTHIHFIYKDPDGLSNFLKKLYEVGAISNV